VPGERRIATSLSVPLMPFVGDRGGQAVRGSWRRGWRLPADSELSCTHCAFVAMMKIFKSPSCRLGVRTPEVERDADTLVSIVSDPFSLSW